ncbi:MAG: redoxin family protein [Deltaproteobacteria bacterium]|nr:redoxin family protein [Deltaproteobacteria bacterium]
MAWTRHLLVPIALLAVAATPGESRDARGWRPRPGPPDPTVLTRQVPPQPVALPPAVAERVGRRTLLVYLSTHCPHCVRVMPEIAALSRRVSDVADTLLILSGFSGEEDTESFVETWKPSFPVIRDADTAFARATGLDATPSLLVVDPPLAGASEFLVTEAWLPYSRGVAAVLEMRIRGEPMAVLHRGEPVGVLACSACHAEEARAWFVTAHANATWAVVRKQRGDDLSCLACHVTLLDRTSGPEAGVFGYRPGEARSPFADVGCEACHTASGPHDGDGGDPRAACARCHVAGHGRFDPDPGLAGIDHFQAQGWTDEAIRKQRLERAQGLLPRPFADLPDGPTVGASRCAACHEVPARQWRQTPHARAMEALQGPGTEACVACHATPGEETGAWRTDESVGCEACHGPGVAHAEDPTIPLETCKSPHPECAVERVCVRCHTPERDPDWSLRTALPRVAH